MNIVPKDIEQYIQNYSTKESEVLYQLNRHTNANVMLPQMLSGQTQGMFLQMISCIVKPKFILEIGTYTGYSTICLASGLQHNGQIFTIDINEELEETCTKYFKKANLTDKITMIIGNALEEIPKLDYCFDLVFIDADKQNYSNYYDLVIEKISTNGVILADNVLWSGKIIEEKKDKDTQAIHLFNEKVANDKRVENVIISIRDGINFIIKK